MTSLWAAFGLYVIAAYGLAWRAGKGSGASEDFWTAGRRLGPGAVGLSISAGFLSISWSCVYAVQLFYWHGLGALWLVTVPWLLALGGLYVLARRYNRLPYFSQAEMVGRRFGPAAARLIAGALIFVFLVWGGAEIYVAAQLLAPSLGLPGGWMIVLLSLLVGGYSILGGFGAVVSTDRLQYVVVALYIGAMAVLAAQGLGELGHAEGKGALSTLFELEASGARSGRPWTAWLAPGLATILLTFLAYLPGWIFETDLWLRVQAARDPKAARGGVAFAALNGAVFVGILPLFIGVAALALFPAEGGAIPAEIGAEGEAIFAALVERYAPPWLTVLVSVGLLAAATSTIDTCVHIVALSLARDWPGRGAPGAPRRSGMGRARWAIGLAVLGAALFAFATESLWDIFYLSSGVLTVAVALPVAAVLLPRVKPAAVLGSAAAGSLVLIAAYWLETRGFLGTLEPAWLRETEVGFILWGALAAGLGALTGQAFGRRSGRPLPR